MLLDRNKLYSILLIACVVGYIWLYYSITSNVTKNKSVEVCLIKHATNIPCPSCGSTRSMISLTKGNFVEAFLLFLFLVFWLQYILGKDLGIPQFLNHRTRLFWSDISDRQRSGKIAEESVLPLRLFFAYLFLSVHFCLSLYSSMS